MIPVANPIPEPDDFEEQCRKKGAEWLKLNPDAKRPRDLWSPFRLDLAEGFGDRCAFGAMWIGSGTVDHCVSYNEDPDQAYEWNNYRYVDGWLNSSKQKRRAADLLDPFEVEPGWFEVILPSLQLRLTDAVPKRYRRRAQNMLDLLPLRDDERIVRQRRAWYEAYQEGMPLALLEKKAPLIAAAVRKAEAAANAIAPASVARKATGKAARSR